MRVFVLTALLTLAAQAVAQVPKDTVLTERRALVLGEPRVAVAQNVRIVSASPSGRYLLVLRERPDAESVVLVPPRGPMPKTVHVVLWDSITEQSRELAVLNGVVFHEWKIQLGTDSHERVTQVRWLTGVDRAILSVNSKRDDLLPQGDEWRNAETNLREAYFIDASAATFRRIYTEQQQRALECTIIPSPIAPVAVKCINLNMDKRADYRVTLQVLDANGAWGPEVKLGKEVFTPQDPSWSEDGRFFQVLVRVLPEGQRFSPRVLRFDPATREHELAVGAFSSYQPKSVVSDVKLVSRLTVLEELADGTLPAWWLESSAATERAKRLVTANATQAVLPNKERFVAFVSNGVLFTRRIAEFPLAKYAEWRAEDVKQEAIMKAGQIAAAIMSYARGNDGLLPSVNEHRSVLLPSLSGPDILDGFTMVTRATNLSQIADKAGTVIGYVETPHGRAVIYADQRTEWENKGG